MFKKIVALIMVASILLIAGCFTNTHVVGSGAKGSTEVAKQQWFALWGLVPITEVDSQELAEGAKDYTVTTQFTPVDIVIGIFTNIVTIQPMTVTVTK